MNSNSTTPLNWVAENGNIQTPQTPQRSRITTSTNGRYTTPSNLPVQSGTLFSYNRPVLNLQPFGSGRENTILPMNARNAASATLNVPTVLPQENRITPNLSVAENYPSIMNGVRMSEIHNQPRTENQMRTEIQRTENQMRTEPPRTENQNSNNVENLRVQSAPVRRRLNNTRADSDTVSELVNRRKPRRSRNIDVIDIKISDFLVFYSSKGIFFISFSELNSQCDNLNEIIFKGNLNEIFLNFKKKLSQPYFKFISANTTFTLFVKNNGNLDLPVSSITITLKAKLTHKWVKCIEAKPFTFTMTKLHQLV
jgi:hypothetical protein